MSDPRNPMCNCGCWDKDISSKKIPQIYIYQTSGGITDWEVMRGDIDVVFVDWDENYEWDIDRWEDVVRKLSMLEDSPVKEQDLKAARENLQSLLEEREEEAEAKEEERRAKIEAAKELLYREGYKVE